MTFLAGRRLPLKLAAVLMTAALVAAACGGDDSTTTDAGEETPAPTTEAPAPAEPDEPAPTTEAPAAPEPAATPEPEPDSAMGPDGLPAIGTPERCEANRAAGTLTFMTGFDFAAAAGIVEVVAAEAEGYFDEMCLDVELQSGFAPVNTTSMAAGATQLSMAASFGELVRLNVNGGTNMIAFSQLGHTAVSGLVVPAGTIGSLADLAGKTVGIKGDLPAAIEAMLASQGILRADITELLLDGFNPVEHLALGIDALPVYKSNEPAVLDREGIPFDLYDPLDYGVPASFAVAVNTPDFYEKHPTVVEDFVRADLKGYYFAAANPEAAVAHAFDLINAADNPLYLAEAHELSRWGVEQSMIENVTPDGLLIGQLNPETLGAEVELLTSLGVFDEMPDWEGMIDTTVIPKLYDDNGELIWIPMN